VTDLDNTLWGGVVGDDGLEGIALGSISAAGEAYAAFGRYLKSLQRSGILLAVNSKNDPALAAEVFDRHPETPLRREDFAAFVCNWGGKAGNLREIARQLNLGTDALVFADDSAAECGEVRRELLEVTVVHLAGDPAHFPRELEALHLFDRLDLTAEDLARARSYQAGRELAASGGSPTSLSDYLLELQMAAEIAPSRPEELPRLEQLFQKTHQFNLTGRQYDQPALKRLLETPEAVCLSCRLEDRLANHGLVSGLVGSVREGVLTIDNWVMSCRVFSRSFEECIFGALLELARARGCSAIEGRFLPTSRNGYAAGLFERLGFRQGAAGPPAVFTLALAGALVPKSYVALRPAGPAPEGGTAR
jgi:FkbH-like protein